MTYGKALALRLGKPLIAVNHLEGHVRAVFLEAHRAGCEPKLPAVCLIVSGGHTVLYEVAGSDEQRPAADQVLRYRRIGQTRDDAAGEAYDKVARLLGLGYPGGPIIDQLAASAQEAHPAGADRIRFTPVKLKGNLFDFSFSGMKQQCSTICAITRSLRRESRCGAGHCCAASAAPASCFR
jgi:N6-L-threonylcarbamoyladenine synthase